MTRASSNLRYPMAHPWTPRMGKPPRRSFAYSSREYSNDLVAFQVRWIAAQLPRLDGVANRHYDGEKSPFFPSATGLGAFIVSDLDCISSSYVGSLGPDIHSTGSTQFFGKVEAAYDAWGPLRRGIDTGECLVHSNHFLFLGISQLGWQWGHDAADIEGACAWLRLWGAVLRQP
jgi:hypothetical protein